MDYRKHILGGIILAATILALLNPLYRNNKGLPIINLGLDLKGGVDILLQALPNVQVPEITPPVVTSVIEILRRRVDPDGVKEIVLQSVGGDRITLQVPGEQYPDKVSRLIKETALLEFWDTGEESMPDNTILDPEKYKLVLTGGQLKKANIQYDQFGGPIVGFEWKPEGARKFKRYTSQNINKYLTITLDKRVISSPVIRGVIGATGVIEGKFTFDEVSRMVTQLNAGALPVKVNVLQQRVVGPSLGQESINKSLVAGIGAFIVILLFMLVMYRIPGFVANVALCLYVVLTLGYLSLLGATLTLPGIAGFILSIGMAVDANIIIFERLKEEIRWGKTLNAAVEAAFARAFVAIFDSNLTTLIAAFVLYFYGTGPIKGFAVTLSLGIIVSMFSAITVTRFFLSAFTTSERFQSLKYYA